MVLLTCVVHPIDTKAHPTVPRGFRWAVMVGDNAFSDMSGCANAGFCPDRREAELEGDQCAATAVRVLQILGVHGRYAGVVHLDHDPTAANEARVNFA